MKSEPIAILCSDLHLSLKRPACRDDDWMAAQANYLGQVSDLSWNLAKKSGWYLGKYFPVIVAGDIFDRWNPAPELLTFAFKHLPPNLMAIPGQHDLPNHRSDEMHRSGYGVLVEAQRIDDLSAYIEAGNRFSIHEFGWGRPITPLPDIFKKYKPREGKCVHIAVVHKFIWDVGGNAYVGVQKDNHISAFAESLAGYDVAVFGDNHKGFSTRLKTGTRIWNCGGFMRRKIDEINYRPRLGILMSDGVVKPHHLDVSADKFVDEKELANRSEVDLTDFVEQLETMADHGLDFRSVIRRHLDCLELLDSERLAVLKCLE